VSKRTPEQIKADDALTAAIDDARRAYWPADAPPDTGIMTDYMVVFVARDWDEDGDSMTAVCTLVRDNDVPPHIILGLLAHAKIQREHFLTCHGGDDE
jgi:hypothetical protein